jgi:hypothetical protein
VFHKNSVILQGGKIFKIAFVIFTCVVCGGGGGAAAVGS